MRLHKSNILRRTSLVLVTCPTPHSHTPGGVNRYHRFFFQSFKSKRKFTVAPIHFILVSIKYLRVFQVVFSYFKGILNYFWRQSTQLAIFSKREPTLKLFISAYLLCTVSFLLVQIEWIYFQVKMNAYVQDSEFGCRIASIGSLRA